MVLVVYTTQPVANATGTKATAVAISATFVVALTDLLSASRVARPRVNELFMVLILSDVRSTANAVL